MKDFFLAAIKKSIWQLDLFSQRYCCIYFSLRYISIYAILLWDKEMPKKQETTSLAYAGHVFDIEFYKRESGEVLAEDWLETMPLMFNKNSRLFLLGWEIMAVLPMSKNLSI